MTSTTESALRAGPRPAPSPAGRFLQILAQLPRAFRIYRERRALLGLSDHSLKDLGLSRADAYYEASRPWWEIPDNR